MRFGKTEIITLLLIGIAVMLAIYAAFVVTQKKHFEESDAGQALKDRGGSEQFTDLQGDTFTFDKYNGKVRVVNVWATWSPFSKTELPVLNTMAEQYDSKQVVFIALNRMEAIPRVENYLTRLGSLDSLIFTQDPNDGFYGSVEGFSMPETIVYDQDGSISLHVRGTFDQAELQSHIDSLLNK